MPRLAWVDALARDALARGDFPGASIGVGLCGEVVHLAAYGRSRLTPLRWASRRTHFLIGSVSKQITAAGFLLLVGEGRICLSDTLASVFPELAGSHGGTTFRHLLSHTAGLDSDLERRLHQRGEEIREDEVLSLLASATVHGKAPGEWSYSNTGYFLTAIAIERLTGVPLRRYLAETVLATGGLRETHFLDHPCTACACGYRPTSAGFGHVAPPNAGAAFGSGDVASTAADLIRWTEALHAGRIVPSALVELMCTPAADLSGTPLTYGLGLFVGSPAGHRELSHDGATGGFSAQVAHYPDDALTVIVLTNGERHVSERIEKSITRGILSLPEAQLSDVPLTPDEVRAVVGTYEGSTATVEVRSTPEGISIRSPSGTWSILRHQGGGFFVDSADPGLTFRFDPFTQWVSRFTVSREGKMLLQGRKLPLT